MGRRPLHKRLRFLRSIWLPSQASSLPRNYAVLAVLSDCCPTPEGRLSTCYSPVRHFTRGRSPFLVRLACVKPAANVRSEPGSNSPVNRWTPRLAPGGRINQSSPAFRRASYASWAYFASWLKPASLAVQFSETDPPPAQPAGLAL